jgi:hypothetical protein
MKEYLNKALEKLFYTLISFKNWVFISIFITSTWLTYIDKIDGGDYTVIISIITPSVIVSREFAKKQFTELINTYK